MGVWHNRIIFDFFYSEYWHYRLVLSFRAKAEVHSFEGRVGMRLSDCILCDSIYYNLPGLLQRIVEYSVLEFSWYILYPEKSKMIVKAFTKNDTDIYKKTILKYGNREQEIYYWFLQNIDTTQFRWDRQKTLDMVKWFLKGFNDDFLTKIQKQAYSSFEVIEKEYIKELSEYIEVLKVGIVKSSTLLQATGYQTCSAAEQRGI